jgi:N6-adenosine-specific RNA methylase IME4
VHTITRKDAALFLWVTVPKLKEVIELFPLWGFEYKTIAFVWVKINKIQSSLFWGMGNWTRSNVEFCLLGMKGKPERVSKGVHQIIIESNIDLRDFVLFSRIEKHSKKPAAAREKIVQLCGDVPRIELFARERASGWDAWGNDIAGEHITDVMSYLKRVPYKY